MLLTFISWIFSCWLNQPNWKICASQHWKAFFPQESRYKYTLIPQKSTFHGSVNIPVVKTSTSKKITSEKCMAKWNISSPSKISLKWVDVYSKQLPFGRPRLRAKNDQIFSNKSHGFRISRHHLAFFHRRTSRFFFVWGGNDTTIL